MASMNLSSSEHPIYPGIVCEPEKEGMASALHIPLNQDSGSTPIGFSLAICANFRSRSVQTSFGFILFRAQIADSKWNFNPH
jgi:hypothetical protein